MPTERHVIGEAGPADRRARPGVAARPGFRADASLLALTALLLRLPAFFASGHLTYDDGFFGLSALEMRHGVEPYRSLFAPQGPLHLPQLFIADILGLRSRNAPRLLPLVAGIVITVLAYTAARRITSRYGAIVAGALVTTSGSVLWVTSGITSDGPAIAWALAAVTVAIVYSQEPTSRRAVAAGALVGAVIAAKVLAAPVGLAVVLLLFSRRRLRDLGLAVAAGVVVLVGVSVPWGLGRVWEQSVSYHRNAPRVKSYSEALTTIARTLFDRDLMVLLAAAIVVVTVVVALLVEPRAAGRAVHGGFDLLVRPAGALAVWLVAQFGLLMLEGALWRPHIAHLITPLVLLICLRPPRLVPLVVAAVVATPWWVHNLHSVLWPPGYTAREHAAVDALRNLPPRALALTDDPGLLWRADRLTVPWLDDSSILRIDQRLITQRTIVDAARRTDVCAVLVWSTRYGGLHLEAPLLAGGYEVGARYGGPRVLYEKRNCRA